MTRPIRTLALTLALTFMPLPVNSEDRLSTPRLPSNISTALHEDVAFLREETVVSALRQEQPISEAPSNIYVITAEDIRQSGATDIPTLLRRVPGMEVMRMTGADINVSTRGGNQLQANKLLVMVDHRSIYNDAQGFVLWNALPVTLPEIQQIEVLIGPASVLYGFNAFDGIVHIITKSPRDMPGTHIQAAGGEFHTGLASAVHAGTLDDFSYTISGGWDHNRQWRDRDRVAFRSLKTHGRIDYDGFDHAAIRVSGGYLTAPDFDGIAFESALSRSQTSQGYVMGDVRIADVIIRAYWMQTNFETDIRAHPFIPELFHVTTVDGRTPGFLNTSTTNVDVQHTVTLASVGRLTYGINIRHNRLTSNITDGFATENRVGMFAQQEISLPAGWQVVAGLRYDMDTFINPTWSPRISLLWTPAPTQSLRASYSIGFRPPTMFETHAHFLAPTQFDPPGTPPITFLGDRNSRPEQITAYELGYQGWFAKHRIRVRGNLFANFIRDLFDPTFHSDIRTTFLTNRHQKATIWGTDIGVEFLATSWLRGFANYTYQTFERNFSDGVATKRTGSPHKWTVGLRGQWNNGLSANASFHVATAATYPLDNDFNAAPFFGQSVPNPRVNDYTLLNVRIGYRFWDNHAEVAVSVFNALNDRHREHPLGDTIGSRALGWLTVRL